MHRHFAIEAPFVAEMEPRLLADLGQRNGAENGPQRFTVGKVEFAPLGSTQESPAGRLHNVFRADSTTQPAGQVFVRQAAQRLAKLHKTVAQRADRRYGALGSGRTIPRRDRIGCRLASPHYNQPA